MSKRGILTIISGFSGVGKGTAVRKMMETYDNYALSVSATTRKPREGEEDGVSYFFKTREEFEEMIQKDQFIEYAQYVDNYYGTPKEYVEQQLASGKDVILEIELQGALKVKEQYDKGLVLIFITPPNAEVLEERLRGRGTEDEATIAKRMARAYEESFYMDKYDYVVVNDVLEQCVSDIHNIVVSQHDKTCENTEFIKDVQAQLKRYSKGDL